MSKGNCIIKFHSFPTDTIVCLAIPFYFLDKFDNIYLDIGEHGQTLLDMYKFVYRNYKQIKVNTIDEYKASAITLGFGIDHSNQHPEFVQTKCLTTLPYKYLAGSEYFYSNYCTIKIPPSECYNSFIIDRDLNLEKERFNEFKSIYGENYIITNVDYILFDKTKLSSNLPVVNLEFKSSIIFDQIMIIENAKEIHIISTFLALIIYYLQKKYNLFNNIPIYFHSYIRHGRLECLYREHGVPSNWTFYVCENTCTSDEHLISGI
jgi:hypothetical protein